jgi:hypothetical protein
MPAITTLAELNRRNREFWDAQQLLLERRMVDTAIRETAFEIMRDEINREVPVKRQQSIYAALEYAENAKQRFFSERGREGGRAKKTDALQELIEAFVERNPALTARRLADKLRGHERIEPIQDIDDGVICFTNHDGSTKTATLSGLKDRLSRAKRKNESR